MNTIRTICNAGYNLVHKDNFIVMFTNINRQARNMLQSVFAGQRAVDYASGYAQLRILGDDGDFGSGTSGDRTEIDVGADIQAGAFQNKGIGISSRREQDAIKICHTGRSSERTGGIPAHVHASIF